MQTNFIGFTEEELFEKAEWKEEIASRRDLPPAMGHWIKNAKGQISALQFTCPCGCGDVCMVSLIPPSPKGWNWNQDKELPTLTPSILRTAGCRWHGYLTKGEFRSC